MKKVAKVISFFLFTLILSQNILGLGYKNVYGQTIISPTLEGEERRFQEKDEEEKRNAVVVPESKVLNSIQTFSMKSSYIDRVSGKDRIATSIEISKRAYRNGSDSIVLAGYSGNADALSGTLFASSEKAPLLLVEKNKVSDELKSEIIRLKPKKIFLLGGLAAISDNVESQIKRLKYQDLNDLNIEVKRISGNNRYDTAAILAGEAEKPGHVFLTLGINRLNDGKSGALADALAIGPVSAKDGKPVLLTAKDYLPDETRDAIKKLKVSKVTVIGGENAVSLKVRDELRSMGIYLDEIKGKDRYETSVKIAERYFPNPKKLIIANGIKDADALVGGYFGKMYSAPIILVHPTMELSATNEYFKKYKNGAFLLGGLGVISDYISNSIENIINSPMVCLDYGHGGKDSGATYKGRREKDDVLITGKLLAAKLRSHGIRVDETRTTDIFLELKERTDFANKKDYDYFVSLHRNAYKPETANGVETYIYPGSSPRSLSLARKIQRNLIDDKVGFHDRKVKQAKFYVIGYTNAPAVLIEVGFLDSTIDNNIYDSKQVQIVDGISSAILEALDE